MNPKLSIIIPCFNSATTLEAAVNSCFLQGFDPTDFEIVLIDDGSRDTTRDMIQTLAQQYPTTIRYRFHEKNQGGGASRNTGASIAHGAVLFFLDSDDLLPEGTLAKMYQHLASKKCDGVGINTSIKFIGNDTANIQTIHTFNRVVEKILLADLLQKSGMCSLYSTFMLTADAFVRTGGYPTTHGFDTQGLAWRFLSAGLYAETVPGAAYLHRVQAGASYYVREYNQGKVNFNWHTIFSEHASLLTPDTIRFLEQFDCADFTRNIFDELAARDHVFASTPQTHSLPRNNNTSVSRTSLKGYWYRIRSKIRRLTVRNAQLKAWLVEFLLTYQDIESRLRSTHPIRTIFAYIGLRLRKIFRVHFVVTAPIPHETIDIVIPTIGKDFELFGTYIDYLKKNLCAPIGKIYVVSHESEAALIAYCSEHNLHFVDERSVLGYGKEKITYVANGINRSGWLFQQLLKLSGDVFVESQKYVIVDSDTLLVQPHYFIENGKTVFFENREWNETYFKSFKKLFGITAPHPLSLTSHMMLFDVARLREMKDMIVKTHNTSWDQAYIACCDISDPSGISDYETYAQWMIAYHPAEVTCVPFYNMSLTRRAFSDSQNTFAQMKKRAQSLSVHSYNR
jgi:glycosyltransferase involved in cell wall biosynthesis